MGVLLGENLAGALEIPVENRAFKQEAVGGVRLGGTVHIDLTVVISAYFMC